MIKILSLSHIIALAMLFNLSTEADAETVNAKIPVKIVAFGDSLTAGYGLPRRAAFPTQLEKKLRKLGHNIKIINAGISGDTASGGLARLNWAIPKGTNGVILELGANDALRGISPAKTQKSLNKIVATLKRRGIEVLIAGMIAPDGMGNKFGRAFNPIFKNLATKYDAIYYPFFLDGVALDPKLNQPDGIHPNAKGVKIIVSRIEPAVLQLIKRVKEKQHAATTN